MASRVNRTYLLRLGIFGVVVMLFLMRFQNELIAAAFYASGRHTEGCTWEGAISSLPTFQRQREIEKRFEAESRRLETDSGGFERWQTPKGEFWVPAGGSNVLFGDLAEQERGIYSRSGLGTKAGDVTLDCGANLGFYTKVALAAGASKVIAIEPVPDNLECLRRNLAREIADGRVVLFPKGVWNKDDVLAMHQVASNVAAHSFVLNADQGGKTLQLPLTTIDKLVDELHLTRVDYIKVDIEGSERQALEGAQQTLGRFHPRMALCVYHLPDDPKVIPEKAHAGWAGYRYKCGPCLPSEGRLSPEVFFFF